MIKLFDDFLYVGVWSDEDIPTYTNWEYPHEELSNERIIDDLFSVLYDLQPDLQCHTLMAYTGDDLLDDRNTHTGEYVLNDEKEYTISRMKKHVVFEHENNILFDGELNEEKYRKAMRKYKLKRKILGLTDMLLETGELESLLKEYSSIEIN